MTGQGVIPPASRATVHPADILGKGEYPSYDFSAKVTCTNDMVMVVERPMYFDYDGWTSGSVVVSTPAGRVIKYIMLGGSRGIVDQ